jgi:hypothetical protein
MVEASNLKVTSMTFDPYEGVKPGDELTVKFQVTNLGASPGAETFTLYLDGEETENKKIFTLRPGEMQSDEFALILEEAKEYEFKIGEVTRKFTVGSKEITVSDLEVKPVQGELLKRELSASFTNPNDYETTIDFEILINDVGYEEKWSVTLQAKGKETKTKIIKVEAGEEQKVRVGEAESKFSVEV